MNLFKRYAISFAIAGFFLYFFTLWVEKKNDGKMPHNLSTKKEEIVSIILLPKRYHEKCVDLSKNDELKYGFNSDVSLSFNLHYHEEGEKVFVINLASSDNLENVFNPQKRAYFCLTWINSGKKESKIKYYFKIIKKY